MKWGRNLCEFTNLHTQLQQSSVCLRCQGRSWSQGGLLDGSTDTHPPQFVHTPLHSTMEVIVMKDGIYLDCETTGLGSKDRICELCMVKVVGGEVIDRYHKMFDPGMPLNKDAERVTGLNYDRDLKGRQQFHPNEVIDWLRMGLPIHAYSAGFDRRMLSQEFDRWLVPFPECQWVDVLKDARELGLSNHKQATVAEHFGIDTSGSHTAGRV